MSKFNFLCFQTELLSRYEEDDAVTRELYGNQKILLK